MVNYINFIIFSQNYPLMCMYFNIVRSIFFVIMKVAFWIGFRIT